MSSLGEWRPVLRKGVETLVRDGRLFMRFRDGAEFRHLTLPLSIADTIRYFDGQRSLAAVITELHRLRMPIYFRDLLASLQKLSKHDFLAQPFPFSTDDQIAGQDIFSDVGERKPWWVFKEWRISGPMSAFGHSRILLAVACLLVLMVVGLFFGYNFTNPISNRFLFWSSNYLVGIGFFVLVSSILLSLRSMFKLLVVSFSSGYVEPLRLRIGLAGIYLWAEDQSLLFGHVRWQMVLFYLASSAFHIFVIALLSFRFSGERFFPDLVLSAIVLTLVDASPYRRSEFTKAASLFSSHEKFAEVLPFLKKRCLLAWTSGKARLKDDAFLMTYSVYAILWALCALSLGALLLNTNSHTLLFAITQKPRGPNNLGALIVFGLTALYLAYSVWDILETIILNLSAPIRVISAKLVRWFSSSDAPVTDIQRVALQVADVAFFDGISWQGLAWMLGQCRLRKFVSGALIVAQDEEADGLYVLLSGSVKVVRHEPSGATRALAMLSTGTIFGETALIENCLRTADVIALENVEALWLPKKIFTALGEVKEYKADHKEMARRARVGQLLSASDLFHLFPREALHLISSRGKVLKFETGLPIVEEGQPGGSFYLLVEGKVEVVRGGNRITEITEGGFFGEISLLYGVPRTATISCLERTVVVRLKRDDFWDLLARNINLAAYLETIAVERFEAASCL